MRNYFNGRYSSNLRVEDKYRMISLINERERERKRRGEREQIVSKDDKALAWVTELGTSI